MIVSWMLYALVVGVLLAIAARVLEGGVRLLRLPLRYIWVGAMLGTLALAAAAPFRGSAEPVGMPVEPSVSVHAAADDAAAASSSSSLQVWLAPLLASARTALHWPQRTAAEEFAGVAGKAAPRAMLGVWLALSLGLLASFAATWLRYRLARRRWPVRVLAGEPVRVAPGTGPAVVGLLRPEIIVPEWLLGAPSPEQRLVVTHEREHVRAGDHALLAFGCLALVLLPWHPAMWWMAARLRLAVELDCDSRVLRCGAAPVVYGSMLVDIAERRAGLPFGAVALANSQSQLERRLLAMTAKLPRRAALRAAVLALPAALLVLAACETALPTSAEIEAMDVAAVEQSAMRMGIAPADDATFLIDGVVVDAESARSLDPASISSIEVVRGATLGADRIEITRIGDGEMPLTGLRPRPKAGAAGPQQLTVLAAGKFDGVLIVDGVVVPDETLRRINPLTIESVEVVRGGAAVRLYDQPAAAQGVIRIRTKPRGEP